MHQIHMVVAVVVVDMALVEGMARLHMVEEDMVVVEEEVEDMEVEDTVDNNSTVGMEDMDSSLNSMVDTQVDMELLLLRLEDMLLPHQVSGLSTEMIKIDHIITTQPLVSLNGRSLQICR